MIGGDQVEGRLARGVGEGGVVAGERIVVAGQVEQGDAGSRHQVVHVREDGLDVVVVGRRRLVAAVVAGQVAGVEDEGRRLGAGEDGGELGLGDRPQVGVGVAGLAAEVEVDVGDVEVAGGRRGALHESLARAATCFRVEVGVGVRASFVTKI